MKTSRLEGILALETKIPYKLAINGQQQQRTEIICHDISAVAESIAFDIEQLFIVATTSFQGRMQQDQKQIEAPQKGESKENEEFYKKDCPSLEEIKKMADGLMILFKMNKEVKYSQLLALFNQLLTTGMIKAVGDTPMTTPIWETVDRLDKEMILFSYIAFFVRPLLSLENLSSKTDKNTEQEAKEEEPTLFGSQQ